MEIKLKKQIEYKEDSFGSKIKIGECEFDIDGNVIVDIDYHDSGEIIVEVKFEYQDNKLTKEICWNENDNFVEIEYKYDTNNELSQMVRKYEDNTSEKEHRVLSDLKEEITNYDIEGKPVRKQIIKYEKKDKIISNEFYEYDQLKESSEYEYDEKGFITKRITFDALNNSYTISKFRTYEENGFDVSSEIIENENNLVVYSEIRYYKNDLLRMIKTENYFDSAKEQIIEEYEYENDILIKETRKNFQGILLDETRYFYDKFGELERYVCFNPNSNDMTITSFEYQYFENQASQN